MPLITFIQKNKEEIIGEFVTFARTLMPAGEDMNETELRDHAEEILDAIGLDMGLAQPPGEQSRKSMGGGPNTQWKPSVTCTPPHPARVYV